MPQLPLGYLNVRNYMIQSYYSATECVNTHRLVTLRYSTTRSLKSRVTIVPQYVWLLIRLLQYFMVTQIQSDYNDVWTPIGYIY